MATLVEIILTIMQRQAEITVDILDTIFSSPQELRSKRYRLSAYGPQRFKTDWADVYRRHRKFYDTLNYLKREGLVKPKKQGRRASWILTRLGREKIKTIKERKKDLLSATNSYLPNLRGRGLTVVTYDIPERARRKRQWLRCALTHMGLKLMQKSVWVGAGQIDEEFIFALREREMLEHVHIFSVDSRGTIREDHQ